MSVTDTNAKMLISKTEQKPTIYTRAQCGRSIHIRKNETQLMKLLFEANSDIIICNSKHMKRSMYTAHNQPVWF